LEGGESEVSYEFEGFEGGEGGEHVVFLHDVADVTFVVADVVGLDSVDLEGASKF
jgi:hypothetical protein